MSGDEAESDALYESCKTSGFFLLDMTDAPEGEDILQDVAKAFDMAETLFEMTIEEKMKYSMTSGKAYG